jgi:hypothetical protein
MQQGIGIKAQAVAVVGSIGDGRHLSIGGIIGEGEVFSRGEARRCQLVLAAAGYAEAVGKRLRFRPRQQAKAKDKGPPLFERHAAPPPSKLPGRSGTGIEGELLSEIAAILQEARR